MIKQENSQHDQYWKSGRELKQNAEKFIHFLKSARLKVTIENDLTAE